MLETFMSNPTLAIVLKAAFVVKVVFVLLVLMSIVSWAIIFYKLFLFAWVKKENTAFLGTLKDTSSLERLEISLNLYKNKSCGRAIFSAWLELKQIEKSKMPFNVKIKILEDNLKRALENGLQTEMFNLKQTLPFLATCSNTAPFIGLFGTVWGIMHAFHAIGLQKSASLATVAPGISEALVATAIGLGVAIPASMAYNHFMTKLQDLVKDFEIHGNVFLNLIQRNLVYLREKEEER